MAQPANALCIHAHFYQPPREHPFTGVIPQEIGAEPYRNFNEKITAECYRPNADLGNFDRLSFNLGPTLASWMETHATETYTRILAADKANQNAIAQVYNHTILPLATEHDKDIQIAWGKQDFRWRFGRDPEGMWLAESAVDMATLAALARHGIRFTILAPWQAEGHDPANTRTLDTTRPYLVELPDGQTITVFFYDANVAGILHKPYPITARDFARAALPMRLDNLWFTPRGDQLLLGASDGEYYGHHYKDRAVWLRDLTRYEAPAAGFAVVALTRWLQDHPAQDTIRIHERTAWSCAHGIDRWIGDCACMQHPDHPDAHGYWKTGLRAALDGLAERLDAVFITHTLPWLRDPVVARQGMLAAYTGHESWDTFFATQGSERLHTLSADERARQEARLRTLCEAQYYRQWMFTSCGFFFEELTRIEPVNDLRYAAKAIVLTEKGAPGTSGLHDGFLRDLAAITSERTGIHGDALYQRELDALLSGAVA